MKMKKEIWQRQYFLLGETTKWSCPTCEQGVLKSNRTKSLFEETAGSKKDHAHDEWEFEYTQFRFAGLLHCTNSECGDIVSCTGTGGYTTLYDDEGNDSTHEEFKPLLFCPPTQNFQRLG